MEQVVTTTKQRLEGPVNEEIIQEFAEKEIMAKQQVEEARAKLKDFEVELVRLE